MTTNILLCGVGGQGTVLASKLIAEAAMRRGFAVRTAETIGMAQRGGCVASHVRIGHEIHSPLIPNASADLINGFEPAEAIRALPYLKKDGAVVASRKRIQPVTAALGGKAGDPEQYAAYLRKNIADLVLVDTDDVCRRLGSYKILNTVLLGAAVQAGKLPFTIKELEEVIRGKLPEKFHNINIEALNALAVQRCNDENE